MVGWFDLARKLSEIFRPTFLAGLTRLSARYLFTTSRNMGQLTVLEVLLIGFVYSLTASVI
jgi:hypothetical protein